MCKNLYIVILLATFSLSFSDQELNVDSLFHKGSQLFNIGEYHESIKQYDIIIAAKLESYIAFMDRGNAKKYNGDINGALLDFRNKVI